MKKLLTALFTAIFLCGIFMATNVHAFLINFDHTGSRSYEEVDRWVLQQQEELNSDLDEWGFLFTYQDKNTGDFTEEFTMEVTKGRNRQTEPQTTVDYSNIFADINLEGNFAGPNITDEDPTISFTGGNVRLYDQSTSTTIGTLDFTSALNTTIREGVIGDKDLSLNLDLVFTYNDDLDPTYFGPTEVDLAGKQWLLSLVGGRIDQTELWDGASFANVDDDTWVIEWEINGETMDADFQAVPEPTTLLLFGTGLLGLAAFGRKKFMKKS